MKRDIAITIGSRLGLLAAGLAVSAVTARFLGPAGRGEYVFVVIFAALIVQFGNLGLHAGNTYYAARDRNALRGLLANSFWVSVVVGGVGIVASLAVVALGLLPDIDGINLMLGALIVAPTLFILLATGLLVGLGRIQFVNFFEVGSRVLIIALMLSAAFISAGTTSFLLASAVSWILSAGVLLFLMEREASSGLRFQRDALKGGMGYTGRAYFVALLGFLVLRANVFVLQALQGPSEVGYYSIGMQVADGLAILPASVAFVLFPDLARSSEPNAERTFRVARRLALWLGGVCLVAALLASPFVVLVFGTEFLPAVPILLALLPGAFFLGITSVLSQYLAAKRYPRSLFVAWVTALLVLVAADGVLVPWAGGVGAAIALSLSYTIMFILVLNAIRPIGRGTSASSSQLISTPVAIVIYPATKQFREQFEAAVGCRPQYITLRELRALPPLTMLRTLRSIAASDLWILFEDEASQALLPLIEALVVVTRAKRIEVVYPDLRRERMTRLGIPLVLVGLAGATALSAFAALLCAIELRWLRMRRRVPVSFGPGRHIAYLKTHLWLGVKAGGSVGHVAGVVNELVRRQYGVDFLCAGDPIMLDRSVRFHRVPLPKRFGLPYELNLYKFHRSFVRHASRVLSANKPSFIYQRLTVSNFTGVILARRLGVPLVMEYNGSEVWTAQNWGRPMRFPRLATLAEEVCLRHAALIVTVSEVLRDELLGRGVEPERIVTYPNGVDPALFNPDRFSQAGIVDLRARHGLSPEDVVVTFVGTFGKWHGTEQLALAIRSLVDSEIAWLQERRVRFLFVGDGVRMTEVRRILGDNGCAEFVAFAGLVPQDLTPSYLASSDILVAPHVPNEDGSRFFGSPTKLFEYMAMGKAIVASDLEQLGFVLRDGLAAESLPQGKPRRNDKQVAVLTRPGDVDALAASIRFLVEGPTWRRVLGANARQRALSTYTWEHHVDAILGALDREVS